MNVIRVAYAGHDFLSTCLVELTKRPDVKLVLCLTEGPGGVPAANVTRIAAEQDAETITGAPSAEYTRIFNSQKVDLLICAAYMHKIPIDDLQVRWAVNVHPTLLPEGRGGNPLPYVIDGRADAAGVSIHRMTADLDRGPLLVQRKIDVRPDTSVDQFYLKLLATAPQLLHELLDDIEGFFAAEQPVGPGSYWREIDDAGRTLDAQVSSAATAQAMHKKFGLFGVRVRLKDGTCLSSRHISATECEHTYEPGTLILQLKTGSIVALADGLMMIDSDAERK